MSRELDAEVAEKVMGWTAVGPMSEIECQGEISGFNLDGAERSIPHYSTDIAAAWTILAKFENVEMEEWSNYKGERQAICAVGFEMKGDARHRSGIWPTMTMAIVIAALKAVEK